MSVIIMMATLSYYKYLKYPCFQFICPAVLHTIVVMQFNSYYCQSLHNCKAEATIYLLELLHRFVTFILCFSL